MSSRFLRRKPKTLVNNDRMFSTSFTQPRNEFTLLYSLTPKIAALWAITGLFFSKIKELKPKLFGLSKGVLLAMPLSDFDVLTRKLF